MQLVLLCCVASAISLGVVAVESKTSEKQYLSTIRGSSLGGDLLKTDDDAGEMTEDDASSKSEEDEGGSSKNEEDDIQPPAPAKIPPTKTCTCQKTPTTATRPEVNMAWEALEELLDVIRDLGPVSGTSHVHLKQRL